MVPAMVPGKLFPFAIVLLSLALAACGGRPASTVLLPVDGAAGTKQVKVFVATTRERSKTNDYGFTSWRSDALNYAQYNVSIPSSHVNGAIEWPKSNPGNAATEMVVTASQALEKDSFAKTISAQGDGRVLVFVHGYNSSYQEALFRLAEIKQDGGFPGTAVAFSWPSRATLTGYVADRESANYSRDYFESFLNDLAATPGVKSIAVMAHSMGNWLTVETLRQARLRGSSPFVSKLEEVFLIAPDVDIDVFGKQMTVIGRLNRPVTVLVSSDDLALKTSQRIAGDVPRVGNSTDADPNMRKLINKFGLRVVDMSKVESDDYLKHSKYTSVLSQISALTKTDSGAASGDPFTRTGLFVLDTAGNILKAPSEILQAAPQ